MIAAIKKQVELRGITRLCHFTPSRNLVHIATDSVGLLASKYLEEAEQVVMNPTDRLRLDGFADHVCCSIQYPNAWYFEKAKAPQRLFRDWVVLFIRPEYLWRRGTKFCCRNAAANFGRGVAEGAEAFEALFAPAVVGASGVTRTRTDAHPAWLPTDEQAEVLIPDAVSRGDVLAIAVFDESQARRERSRLRQLEQRVPPLIVAPTIFQAKGLSSRLRSGLAIEECEFVEGEGDV
jgi:hypothetical protein